MGEAVDKSLRHLTQTTSPPWSPICAACRRLRHPICPRRKRAGAGLTREGVAASDDRARQGDFRGRLRELPRLDGGQPADGLCNARRQRARSTIPRPPTWRRSSSSARRGRHQSGHVFMPAFGNAYSDTEIAAVANYVTARFGSTSSNLKAEDISAMRRQAP